MVSSSFQTENLVIGGQLWVSSCARLETYCWMYLGRQDSRYWPYWCSESALCATLSVYRVSLGMGLAGVSRVLLVALIPVGLTIGAWSLPCGPRCA